jgi:hypothetical protein
VVGAGEGATVVGGTVVGGSVVTGASVVVVSCERLTDADAVGLP